MPVSLVIGGGVIGLCTAYYLQEAGDYVIIVEQNSNIAQGASEQNAGHLCPSQVAPSAGRQGLIRSLLLPKTQHYVDERLREVVDLSGDELDAHREHTRLRQAVAHASLLAGDSSWRKFKWLRSFVFASWCSQKNYDERTRILYQLATRSRDLTLALSEKHGFAKAMAWKRGSLIAYQTQEGFQQAAQAAEWFKQLTGAAVEVVDSHARLSVLGPAQLAHVSRLDRILEEGQREFEYKQVVRSYGDEDDEEDEEEDGESNPLADETELEKLQRENPKAFAYLESKKGPQLAEMMALERAQRDAKKARLQKKNELFADINAKKKERLNSEKAALKESLLVAGAIYSREDWVGNCHTFCTELTKILQQKGVFFYFNNKPLSVQVSQDASGRQRITHVVTDKQPIAVDRVVVCAGVHTPALLQDVFQVPLAGRLRIEPLKGHALTLNPDLEASNRLDWPVIQSNFVLGESHTYVSVFGSSSATTTIRLTNGADLDGFDMSVHEERAEWLSQLARRLKVPERIVAQARVWTGLRPVVPSGIPYITAIPQWQNLYINAGHGTLGWTLAAASGRLCAEMMTDTPNPVVDPAPFQFDSPYH